MVQIELHSQFTKSYRKRILGSSKLVINVTKRIDLFKADPTNHLLKDHALSGKKSHLRAFWVSEDIRIVYLPVSNEQALFLDIGSHNQVY